MERSWFSGAGLFTATEDQREATEAKQRDGGGLGNSDGPDRERIDDCISSTSDQERLTGPILGESPHDVSTGSTGDHQSRAVLDEHGAIITAQEWGETGNLYIYIHQERFYFFHYRIEPLWGHLDLM